MTAYYFWFGIFMFVAYLIVTDDRGVITYINPTALKLTESADAIGKNATELSVFSRYLLDTDIIPSSILK